MTSRLLPYSVIVRASEGDIEAINVVLKHYEGYIAVLATRSLYDQAGGSHNYVDEDLRRLLETKLITKVLDFKAA